MDYVKRWIKNLITDLLIIVGICIFMLIFMKIFYPDSLAFISLTGQFSIQLISVLKLWPLVILAVIAYSMPRRSRN